MKSEKAVRRQRLALAGEIPHQIPNDPAADGLSTISNWMMVDPAAEAQEPAALARFGKAGVSAPPVLSGHVAQAAWP